MPRITFTDLLLKGSFHCQLKGLLSYPGQFAE